MIELSDLLVAYEPGTSNRLPVRRSEVLERLREAGDKRGAKIVEQLPSQNDVLDPVAVDSVLLRAHGELQRLSEEHRHGQRVARLLSPLLRSITEWTPGEPLWVVDIGCGLGYVIRYLAASRSFGRDVELVGVDQNAALIAEARRLAADERLRCRFVVAVLGVRPQLAERFVQMLGSDSARWTVMS